MKNSCREVVLICILLILFLSIHSDFLFFNKYRTTHDTFASYSEFYYALNSFRNITLPLWDPYTHGGQPFYYHFVKIHGGELSIIFFSLISYLFNISIMTLYHYQVTLHFLVFVFGCFYLARLLFPGQIISYYVLLLVLFSSYYGSILGQSGALIIINFLPWFMAFFILLVRGRLRPHHIFAFVLIFILYAQSVDIMFSFYFLFLFCILYCIFFRKQLSRSQIHWALWAVAAFILCLGLLKSLALFSEKGDIFPSLRAFYMPCPSKISSNLSLVSPLDQVSPAYIRDYLSILNPLFGRYGGSELKFYLGFIPAFFAFYAFFASRNKIIWALAIPGVLSAWVSLGSKMFLSSLCFYVLPLFKYIRAMEHFSLAPVYISFVFISAFGFEGILKKIDASKNFSSFSRHIWRFLWFFIITGIIITVIYHKGFIKSFFMLLYYFLLIIGILVFWYLNRKLQKTNAQMIRITTLLSAILILIIALVLFARIFFGEIFLNMNRLILISISFCFILGYIILHLKELDKKRLSIIGVVCFGIIIIDLLFITSFSVYLRVVSRADAIVPESVEPFKYQAYRMGSFWPSGLKKVHFLRPSMLYLQSSIITKDIYRECDYYMLRKFWDGYQRFPERIKRIVMGVDMPKLVFFTDYKVMEDEAVFKECENLNPELLKRFVFLAPNDNETPAVHKISTGQTSPANIEVEHFDNNGLKLSIDAKEKGLLYYSDGYDKKWRCFVDGKQQPIHRANIAFKAVFIPEGRHTVLFIYRPILYLVSFWLFIGACSICCGSAFWCWFKRR